MFSSYAAELGVYFAFSLSLIAVNVNDRFIPEDVLYEQKDNVSIVFLY